LAESQRANAFGVGITSVNALDVALKLVEKGQLATALMRIIEYLQGSELRTLAEGWKYSDGVLTAGLLKAGLTVDGIYEGTHQVARLVGVSEGLTIKLLTVWERLCEEVFREWQAQSEPLAFIDVYVIACLPQVEQVDAWQKACKDYQKPVSLLQRPT
jgi:hypothetical protein